MRNEEYAGRRKMDLRVDLSFINLLRESYFRFTGHSLVPDHLVGEDVATWLYEIAPFGLLAHNSASDPVFVYGNKAAQRLFEYGWDELVSLPSRLSAEAPDRDQRQRFLEDVQRNGYVTGYRGVRISKSGKRFVIEDATVWQLIDANAKYHGQAALLPKATYLSPNHN
jgi:PAS domain-containing protein